MRSTSALLLSLLCVTVAPAGVPGLRVPAGFEVTEVAGDDLAHDVTCMTADADGRVIVSGPGYVRRLTDADGDGRADGIETLVNGPAAGAMGLFAEADALLVVGGDGLIRLRDGRPTLVMAMKGGGEHDAHAVRRGPDGRLWWLVGNMARLPRERILPSSPVPTPVAGTLLRLAEDEQSFEVVAHGLRNAYAFDFDDAGDAYTFDSDNERCLALPWYEPTRFYRLQRGGHHGWLAPGRAAFWRRPPDFPDCVPPLATLGRGSPTGVLYSRGVRLPQGFGTGFFLADWTLGRVVFAELRADGPVKVRPIVETTGTLGFAPTALALDAKRGDLLVSVGGRGTRGAVYRVRFTGTDVQAHAPVKLPPAPAADPAVAALRSLQQSAGDLGGPGTVGTVWEGYSLANSRPAWRDAQLPGLRALIGDSRPAVEREALRLLAALEDDDPQTAARVLASLKAAEPIDRTHRLIVLARLRPEPDSAPALADALVRLDSDLDARGLARERHWPLRLAEVVARLCERVPDLAAAIVAHPDFGRPDHRCLVTDAVSVAAAKRFRARIDAAPDDPWPAGVVALLAELPPAEALGTLRKLADRPDLRDAALPALARAAGPADRTRLVLGLGAAQDATREACLAALSRLPASDDSAEAAALVRWLRGLGTGAAADRQRGAIASRLSVLSNESHGADAAAWAGWLVRRHPDAGHSADWMKRFARTDWDAGDAARGQAAYTKAGCVSCHGGGQRLGPDLAGVGRRFTQADLLTAIADPDRDIPARYRATEYTTTDDQIVVGMPVYEAADGVILQTPTATLRLDAGKIESRRPAPRSLMPAGLLDGLSEREVADLLAYLRGM